MRKVVVVLSGGMDSATLLAKCIADGHHCTAFAVNYGQRHARELACAQALAEHYQVRIKILDMSELSSVMRGSSQTDKSVPVPLGHYEEPSMKKTVVPNRNMLLLGTAAAHAISIGFDYLAYGAHAGDHAIYPDCRHEFVEAMQDALAECHYSPIWLMAPFLALSKGDIAKMGLHLGVPYEKTWTCYKGEEYACGQCGSCTERLEAFKEAGAEDPLEYRPF